MCRARAARTIRAIDVLRAARPIDGLFGEIDCAREAVFRRNFFIRQTLKMTDLVGELRLPNVRIVAKFSRAVCKKFRAANFICGDRFVCRVDRRNDGRIVIICERGEFRNGAAARGQS